MVKKNITTMPLSASTTVINSNNIVIKKLNTLIAIIKNRHIRHYRDNSFHLWADLLLAGILIGLVVIVLRLVFWQPVAEFSLTGKFVEARILSGQTEEFVISYKNEEDNLINSASLVLNLPENFVIESALPKEDFNSETKTFNLGDLEKNDHGELRLRGIVRGEIGERQVIGLNLNYQFGQIRKQLLNSVVYFIDGSVMELNLDVPNETYKDVPFSGSVEVKNAGQTKIANSALMFDGPDWEIIPDELTLENGQIVLSAIEPGESVKILFSAISKQGANSGPLAVSGLFLIGDKVFKQVSVSKNINVSEPSLVLTAIFKDKALTNNQVNSTLTFNNAGKSDISNLAFNFESKRTTMGVSSVTTTNKDFTVANNSLTYNKNLLTGEKKDVDLMINLEHRGSDLNDWLNLNVTVVYTMDGKQFKYSVPMPKLKINSNLTVTSAGYYYGPQGDQLGIGPIPPQVDIPTTYWVIWEANNLGNDIANFEVSADMPANVVWLDQKSVVAGDVTYSPVSRRILWQIDKLDQTGGNYRASFAISLVPRTEDLGTVPNLLSSIQFKAKDLYTDDILTNKLANITTNIEKDRQAAGKGKVQPLQ